MGVKFWKTGSVQNIKRYGKTPVLNESADVVMLDQVAIYKIISWCKVQKLSQNTLLKVMLI